MLWNMQLLTQVLLDRVILIWLDLIVNIVRQVCLSPPRPPQKVMKSLHTATVKEKLEQNNL